MLKAGVAEDPLVDVVYSQRLNRIGNLQLLEALPNIEKSDQTL